MKKITLLLTLFLFSLLAVQAQRMNVASYNIRYANDGDANKGNGWERRCPVIVDLIRFHDFDIFGSQEVLNSQLNDLREGLPEYDYIGVGRDDGATEGEYAPIFYKKDRFQLIYDSEFWLSENTRYPNKGWDAALPRICTYGRFWDKKYGRAFWFFNLHMDHVGVKARAESAKLVMQMIEEICEGEPVILTGDFNVDQHNESYHLLAGSELFDDSFETAKIRYAENGTFNAFDVNLMTNSRIDHVFVTQEFSVERYGILTDTYRAPKGKDNKKVKKGDFPSELSFEDYEARLPSDHFPVAVELSF